MERRRFILKAGGALVAAGAAVAAPGPYVHAQQKFTWRMATSWPPGLATIQGGPVRFAKLCDQMSGGRLKIQVFAGGELMPPLGVFDAVSKGTVEAGASASYYWAGKHPATQWFCAVPFGLNAQGMNAWFYGGGGLKLWEEVYKPFNLVPRPGGNTGVQMAGWFRKKINAVSDYKGLKMRIPGLGGKVVAKAGGTVVLLPGGEIYTALERGVIDAAEWVGPYDDLKLGLHQAARYYYYPGWHEPGTVLEHMFSAKAYDALPADLKQIVDAASAEANLWMLSEYTALNIKNLEDIKAKFKGKVEVLALPADVLKELRKHARDVLAEEAAKDPLTKKVYEAFNKFQAGLAGWDAVSEDPYHRYIAS